MAGRKWRRPLRVRVQVECRSRLDVCALTNAAYRHIVLRCEKSPTFICIVDGLKVCLPEENKLGIPLPGVESATDATIRMRSRTVRSRSGTAIRAARGELDRVRGATAHSPGSTAVLLCRMNQEGWNSGKGTDLSMS